MRNRTAVGLAAVTVTAMIGAVYSIDLGRFGASLAGLSLRPVLIATLLTTVALVIAYVRFDWTLRALYPGHIQRRPAIAAFVLGNLASHLLFNVFGQSLTRAAILQSRGIPVGVTVSATYIERLGAFVTLGLAASAAVFLLFGGVHIDLARGGNRLLQLAVGGSVALAAGVGWALACLASRDGLREAMALAARLAPTALLGLAIHFAYFLVYWVLIRPFASGIDPVSLGAAIVVVMFVASIPISLSGWGLREFSAAYVMSAIGVSTEAAVLMAVIVGVLSLLVSAASGGIVLLAGRQSSEPAISVTQPEPAVPHVSDRAFIWVVAVLAASLVLVQARVPVGAIELTVNAADPLALTAFMLAAYFAWKHRLLERMPKPVLWAIAGLAAALVIGAVVAWLRFGGGAWTLLNRLLGYVFLLGYLSVGGLVVAIAGERGRRVVTGTFLASAAAIVVLQFAVSFTDALLYRIPPGLLPLAPEGLAQNRNAFAFQLLMVFAVAYSMLDASKERKARAAVLLSLAAITAVIFHTGSRSGAAIAAFGLAAALLAQAHGLTGRILERLMRFPRTGAIGLVMTALLAHVAVSGMTGRMAHPTRVSDDLERWRTVSEGLTMWWEHPLIGSGLGAYIARHQDQLVHVIHSVPVWFLAELGVVGFVGYFAFLVAITDEGFRIATQPYSRGRGVALLLAVAFFILMGLAHDIFFQRTFWLALGLLAGRAAAEAGREGEVGGTSAARSVQARPLSNPR
jgi:uncharacterized membrane protein YbhN (UPF0104 family)